MKHKRIRVEKEVANGWSRWVQPVMKGYLLSCCDCSLVHRLDFRTWKGRIQFRAQRAPAYTRRERAKKPYRPEDDGPFLNARGKRIPPQKTP